MTEAPTPPKEFEALVDALDPPDADEFEKQFLRTAMRIAAHNQTTGKVSNQMLARVIKSLHNAAFRMTLVLGRLEQIGDDKNGRE